MKPYTSKDGFFLDPYYRSGELRIRHAQLSDDMYVTVKLDPVKKLDKRIKEAKQRLTIILNALAKNDLLNPLAPGHCANPPLGSTPSTLGGLCTLIGIQSNPFISPEEKESYGYGPGKTEK